MRIEHKKKRSFSSIADVASISHVSSKLFDSEFCTSYDVVKALCEVYNNLLPLEVETMVFKGTYICKNHFVCYVKDSNMLIDPTGDTFTNADAQQLKTSMTPWFYLGEDGVFYSRNHLPYLPDGYMTFPDAVWRTGTYPEYSDFRRMTLY